MSTIQSIKGIKTLGYQETIALDSAVKLFEEHVSRYGFQRWELPFLEPTQLFKRSLGTDSDIIGKEMYSFEDQNGIHTCLRPEGTAGVVRAGIENGSFRHQIQRIYYKGPMFRREKPQKGRSRQFFQCGVEFIGSKSIYSDVEVVCVVNDIFKKLNLNVTLEINSIGSIKQRKNYSKSLISYLEKYENELDEDSKRRLKTNPMRILDSKVKHTQSLLYDAPVIYDFLSDQQKQNFISFQKLLSDNSKSNSIRFKVNHKLVRGLDYYSDFVYEWKLMGSNTSTNTLAAGGRYDQLLPLLGGSDSGAVGCALGIDRIIAYRDNSLSNVGISHDKKTIYIIPLDELSLRGAVPLANKMRNQITIPVVVDYSLAKLSSQIRHSESHPNCIYLTIGKRERENNKIMIKYNNSNQKLVDAESIISTLKELL